MAVAVKNPPVSAASNPYDRMPVVSLVGAAYVVVCLGIVFGVLPYLWRTAVGFTTISGDVLLGLLMLAAFTALAVVGARLLGPKQPAGARAGIFAVLAGFVLVLLLTRWASLWLEYEVYTRPLFGDSAVTTGLVLTGLIALALVALGVYLFLRPEAEKYLMQLEGQGWFSATAYKGLQGQRVRRGTILGILLLAGSGVYTMMNNGFLRRMPERWSLNIPFTGMVALQSLGDAGPILKGLPPQVKDQLQVQIVGTGDTGLPEGDVVTQKAYRDALNSRIDQAPDLSQAAKDRLKEQLAGKDTTEILDLPGSSDALVAAVGPAALVTLPPAGLPVAELRMNRFALRDVNDQLNREYVRVADPPHKQQLSTLTTGSLVTTAEFDAAASKIKSEEDKPVKAAPFAAAGVPVYRPLTLLPALRYTLPLLLLAASIWLAWRVVNFPPFADFLIATEAELNKVSWTTRPRLIQDTIVVLVTVALLAIFLFLMDQTWRVVLSWKPIGVLQLTEDQSEKNKSAELKPW
jgi:preprotein translocase SecE subunit